MFHNVTDAITGEKPSKKTKYEEENKVKGTVVLMKSNFGEFLNFTDSLLDMFHEIFGHKISLQLVSSVHCESGNGLQGKLGKPAFLEKWTTFTPLMADECACEVTFDWDEEIGVPGAFIIRNEHHSEFHLKSLTLKDVPGAGRIHFACNSWVYPAKHYKKDRVFFANKTYLPHETPMPLRKYREDELMCLRGDGKGERQECDRIYDYDIYNDLGNPDSPEHVRPVLGGSAKYPYPRRCRTGRSPTKSDPNTESRLLPLSLSIYVPRDERFGHAKMSDAIAYILKLMARIAVPGLECLRDNEFECIDDLLNIYENDEEQSDSLLPEITRSKIPWEFLKEIFRSDGEKIFKFSRPHVIKKCTSAWRTDEEFAREMLAGLNPVVIRRLEEFPPKSKLDRRLYGDQNSTIRTEHIENSLDGMSVDEAIAKNKLYILDYHDAVMPYIKLINTTSTKAYATRTLVFLKDDGTLKPVAIELSLPHPEGAEFGAMSQVYTPAEDGIQGGLWMLAKAYVAVNDTGYHQLISHWLYTHATIEPFVIATNRLLSVLHPIYKLLHPHFRDTMNINALARQTLINAGGLLEFTVFPAKYSLELSSSQYKNWVFTEQALPEDLKKRGIAVEDPTTPQGIRLLIEDYPYAVDGLKIWTAIREWVSDYCSYYYQTDDMVQKDPELQSWWTEVREEGHGDLREKTWWPKMQSRDELIQSCTIIIWIASALHAAINFGQYPYGGFLPNRPSISRRFMPEKGSPEYSDLESKADEVFLKTITSQFQTLVGVSLIEVLSRHTSEEVYLGQRETEEWTTDSAPLEAFKKFGEKLAQIEDKIIEMNNDSKLKNRTGPVNMPYTLLIPSSQVGLTGRGIPNSISI